MDMKLLLITSVAEFAKQVKQILKQAQVHSYSYNEVVGFRNTANEALHSNWFGTELNENKSVLFYAFVPSTQVNWVCDAIGQFNIGQQSGSHIHIAVLNIEKTN